MYGKVQRGLLIVDSGDTQVTFEVEGKTPEYIPPGKNGTIIEGPTFIPNLPVPKIKKRNIIMDNIKSAGAGKIAKPKIPPKNSH